MSSHDRHEPNQVVPPKRVLLPMSSDDEGWAIAKPVVVSVLVGAWLASVVVTQVQRDDWTVTLVCGAVMALACSAAYFMAP